MAKFNLWDFRIKNDDYFFELVNYALRFRAMRFRKDLKPNRDLKDLHRGQRAWIILSGPSLNKQDIRPLKDDVLFFVNRAFKHKDYAYLKPSYHLFIDSKMATGEWPLSYLDEILEVNPDVTFLLNYRWARLPQFQEYKKKAKIYWIDTELMYTPFTKRKMDLTRPVPGGAIFGACLAAAIYMGCKPIYFTGFDGNGLAFELTQEQSHFYGTNEENHLKATKDYVKDLYMMSRSLHGLMITSNYCKSKDVEIYNVTEGGIIEMFPRKRFSEVVAEIAPVAEQKEEE